MSSLLCCFLKLGWYSVRSSLLHLLIYVLLRLRVQNRRRKTKSAAQFQTRAVKCDGVFFRTSTRFFNMVFNTPNINIFNTPWNFDIAFYMHYSFQHMLKFSTCFFTVFRTFWNFNMLFYSFQNILKFQHVFLQFSEHTEIFNMLFYSFQNILKFQHAFFTVFRTYWNFPHAFSQFSEHAEIFNMLFYSFKHSFSICLQHALQISTGSEIFNTLSNMKI